MKERWTKGLEGLTRRGGKGAEARSVSSPGCKDLDDELSENEEGSQPACGEMNDESVTSTNQSDSGDDEHG